MPKRVEVLEKKNIFQQSIFTIEEAKFRHELPDGEMTDVLTRVNLNRGDGVAAVIHNLDDNTLIFIEQFRYSTHEKGPGWMLEVPAGILNPGEDPRAAMQRELEEEIGYTVNSLQHISTFYPSPGGSSERIFLFYAKVSAKDKKSSGGGLMEEGEYLRIVTLSVPEAMEKIITGEIADAKSIIGLQWLQLHPQT